ncbi:hydantoinase B/oxoprolinase family protein [Bosea sp. 2YAB26]|uniref:hydantoinase B/oxoprolinase family protein n=1 Tax=Bosea sp. 2YAB26 TaxID=3237478 RepID=UPI003F90F3D9
MLAPHSAPHSGPELSRSDPVTLEIVKNALASIADEMALVILRSAYSPIVRDSMDYSTALCDRNGLIIAQGLTNPVHLGSFPSVMVNILKRFGGTMQPGDGYITNDPYGAGGMHLPDVYLVKPVFHAGHVEGFVASLVHHTDLGGMAPGSMALHATEIFQEGLRIPLIKVMHEDRMDENLLAFLEVNSRVPEQVLGDLRAQIAACAAAERGFGKVLEKYGAPAMRGMLAELHAYAERLVRDEIRAMPDGVYEAEDFIDGLGEGGGPIRFKVTITVAGDELEIDWTGTSGEVPGAINGPVAITYSVAYAALRCAVQAAVPNCEGYTRPVRVVAPLGTIVNPRPPAACAARGVMAYRMLDVLFNAFAQIVPDRMPAAGEGGPSAVSLSGIHEGKTWLITDGILGSWGGRATKDGVDGIANPGANLSNMPIELIEARYPLRIESYGLVANSGGAGRRRGGMAITRSYRILGDDAQLTIRSDRRAHLPPGLFGGCPGSPSLNIIDRNGTTELLPVMPMRTLALSKGDLFTHVAPGGAGNGDPLERDPDHVAADVRDGRFTREFARDVYGVVTGANGRADRVATDIRRDGLASDLPKLAEAQLRLFMDGDQGRAALSPEYEGEPA